MKRISLVKIVFFALFLLAALPAIRVIVMGGIPFWYDPARDLLAAQNIWSKPTLIGPPTGIPGIFYGPLWIWILGLAIKITGDPAVITALVLTIPYLIFLPLIFWQLQSVLGIEISLAVGLTIISSHEEYLSQLWNIYPSALIFMLVFLLVTRVEKTGRGSRRNLLIFLLGLSASVLTSFHLSLAVAVVIAAIFFVTIFHRHLKSVVALFAGIVVPLLPTLFFEMRHGFHQIQLLIAATVFHSYADLQVLALHGLSKQEVMTTFLTLLPTTFGIAPAIFLAVLVIGTVLIFRGLKHKEYAFSRSQFHSLIFLILVQLILMTSYLTSKNPVWPYHFITVEVPMFLIFALLFGRSKLFRWILLLFVLGRLGMQTVDFFSQPTPDYLTQETLVAKQQIVADVYANAKGQNFSWVAYETELVRTLTPDYDYLFADYSRKLNLPLPDKTGKDAKIIYLIIYSVDSNKRFRFSEMDAPVGANTSGYHLVWEKQLPDGTWIQKKSR